MDSFLLLEHLETVQDNDLSMDQELFKFRAMIGHQGPLAAPDPDWKGKTMECLSGMGDWGDYF